MADKTEKRDVSFVKGHVELRKNSDGKQMITGQAIVYERESDPIYGEYVEIIKRGALDNADMSRVVARTNHDDRQLLGTSWGGTLRMVDTAEGLNYEVDIPDTTAGNDTRVYMERGDIEGSSFAFTPDYRTAGAVKWIDRSEEKMLPIREIHMIKRLYDVAPVTTPAYPDAKSALRSFNEWKEEERAKAEEEVRVAKEKEEIKLKADSDTLAAINHQLKLKK